MAEAAEKLEAERIAAEEEAERKREAEKTEKPEEDEDAWDKDSEPVLRTRGGNIVYFKNNQNSGPLV